MQHFQKILRCLLLTSITAALTSGSLLLCGCHRYLVNNPVTPSSSVKGIPAAPTQITHRPLAVMIENSPDARPQSGIVEANVVYEAITEGGITRFLAIYLNGEPAVIGPVRSARPHFIYLAQEYDPIFVHCGESEEALQILSGYAPVRDLDQLKHGKPFWRSHARSAPHNLYTSCERLRDYTEKQGWDHPTPTLPNFSNGGQITNGTPAHEVCINFNGAIRYRLRFVYDAQRSGYLRYMDGTLHVDKETGNPIIAKNIVIQRVASSLFPGSHLHTYDVNVIGSGQGIFISQGQQASLYWNKDNSSAITQYTDAKSVPLPFQPGQTWIEEVPLTGSVTITPALPSP